MAKQKSRPKFAQVRSLSDLHKSVREPVRFQYDGSLRNKKIFRAQYRGTKEGLAFFSQPSSAGIHLNVINENDIEFNESGRLVFKKVAYSHTITQETDSDRYETLHQGLKGARLA
nr:hypothetical protein [uncultured archaeon]AQS33481.1 hypothetical protein [uncultured archaeon]